MRVEVRVVPVSAYVVPVDVRGDGRDRLVRQPAHLRRDVADAESSVDQQGSLVPFDEVAVRLLPMTVFADGVGILIDCLYREPGPHRRSFPWHRLTLMQAYRFLGLGAGGPAIIAATSCTRRHPSSVSPRSISLVPL